METNVCNKIMENFMQDNIDIHIHIRKYMSDYCTTVPTEDHDNACCSSNNEDIIMGADDLTKEFTKFTI